MKDKQRYIKLGLIIAVQLARFRFRGREFRRVANLLTILLFASMERKVGRPVADS